MTRYKLTIEYDGRPFVGFQRQDNGPSVQAVVERAIKAYSGEDATIYCAGRTDAGVHARGQVVHVDLERGDDAFVVMNATNAHMRGLGVAVIDACEMNEDFHARFSATGRRYLYRIINRRTPLTFDRGLAWRVPVELDAVIMHEAAQLLVGQHDFTTFRHVHCQAKSPIKTLDEFRIERLGEDIHCHIRARSFLHHQVRSMVGCLKLVGEGKWSVRDLKDALDAKDRAALGLNAPSDGLYFMEAFYENGN